MSETAILMRNWGGICSLEVFFLVGVVGVVAVVGLVVHDQLPVDEVEAVGPGVERMSHHLTDQLRIQLRKVVDLKRLSRVL